MPTVPKGAKQPQDRLLKADATEESVGIDFKGQSYAIDADVFTDVEVLELLADMQENNLLLPRAVRTILGDEQWAAFKAANRNEKGRVPVDLLGELFEVMDAAVGNSVASPGS